MREIPKKNYCILVVLLVVTVLLTLSLVGIYKNKDKLVSDFYSYSNIITPEDFDQFMTENSDVIIYISEKYDLAHGSFESDLMNKIDSLNLKHNLIYIDKSDINKNFINKLKEQYKTSINLKNTPIMIVIIEGKVVKNVSINRNANVDTLIDYEAFE